MALRRRTGRTCVFSEKKGHDTHFCSTRLAGARPRIRIVARRDVRPGGGRSLADAQVVVAGTRIGGITSSTGEFTLTGVPTGARSVTVRRIGYQPVTQAVNVDASATATVDVRLTVSAVNLTDVVVTGTGAPTERRKVGTSVGSVDSAMISKTQAQTVDQARQGKVPGAQVTQNADRP